MAEIVKKQVCKCEHCGNEAEMVITCSLQTPNEESSIKDKSKTSEKIKGTATCSHCGNEADMWLDI
jgi:ribosomal protein S14